MVASTAGPWLILGPQFARCQFLLKKKKTNKKQINKKNNGVWADLQAGAGWQKGRHKAAGLTSRRWWVLEELGGCRRRGAPQETSTALARGEDGEGESWVGRDGRGKTWEPSRAGADIHSQGPRGDERRGQESWMGKCSWQDREERCFILLLKEFTSSSKPEKSSLPGN